MLALGSTGFSREFWASAPQTASPQAGALLNVLRSALQVATCFGMTARLNYAAWRGAWVQLRTGPRQ